MTAARRLAAILAADVVGYSRLMARTRRGRRGPFGDAAACELAALADHCFRAAAANNHGPAWIAGNERIIDGLRKAGAPEE